MRWRWFSESWRSSSTPLGVSSSRRWRRSRLPVRCTMKPWRTSWLSTRDRLCLVMLQDAEEVAHAHLRMAPDEIDDAVMGAAEAVAREHRVGLGGEVAIGEIEQLDPLAQLVLARRGWPAADFMSAMLTYFRGTARKSLEPRTAIIRHNGRKSREARGTLTWP